MNDGTNDEAMGATFSAGSSRTAGDFSELAGSYSGQGPDVQGGTFGERANTRPSVSSQTRSSPKRISDIHIG
jgi:hypothetical protein